VREDKKFTFHFMLLDHGRLNNRKPTVAFGCQNSLRSMNYFSDFILFLESITGKMIPKSIAERNEVSQSIIATP
jgi:hypothetical protein